MNFEELRQRMDWRRFYTERLEHPPKGQGEWLSVRCPIHGDKAASARISSVTGYFKCFAGCTPEAIPADELGVRMSWWATREEALDALAAMVGLASDSPHEPAPPARKSIDFPPDAKQYLADHGITQEYARSRGLYWDSDKSAIAIPRYDHDGSYRGCKYRRLRSKNGRFLADEGPVVLYGAERIEQASTHVVIAEGEIDSLALQSRMEKSIVVGLPGVETWRDEWTPLLDGRDVILCLDADDAGAKGAKNITDKIRARARVSLLRVADIRPLLADDQKDLGEYFSRPEADLLALLDVFESTESWSPPRIYQTAAEFFADEPPEDDPALVSGLVPSDGITILGGEPKTGKTYLALHLAFTVAAGLKTPMAPSRPLCAQGPVWFLSEEDSPRRLKRRGWRVARGLELDPRTVPVSFTVMQGVRIDRPEWLEKLATASSDVKPILIVLDALAALHGADENDASAMARVFYPLVRWCEERQIAVLILHHFSKAKSRGGSETGAPVGSRLRGSSAVWGAVRGIIGVEPKDDNLLEMSAQFNDFPTPEPYLLRPRWVVNDVGKSMYTLDQAGTTIDHKKTEGDKRQRALEMELAHALTDEFQTEREVRETLGWNSARFAKARDPLIKRGLVERADFHHRERGIRTRTGVRLTPEGLKFVFSDEPENDDRQTSF